MSCSFVHSTIHLQKMPLGKLSVFCIRYFSKTKCKPAKKIAGQCFSTQVKAACTHSANLERETEITKIITYPLFPLAFSIHLPPPRTLLNCFQQCSLTVKLLGNLLVESEKQPIVMSLVWLNTSKSCSKTVSVDLLLYYLMKA